LIVAALAAFEAWVARSFAYVCFKLVTGWFW
jgi:hypothetical protein